MQKSYIVQSASNMYSKVCSTSTVAVLTWTQNSMQALKITQSENMKLPNVGFEPITLAVLGMPMQRP